MAGPEIVDVAYGEGWHSGRAAVLGPIDTAVAAARDAAGLPYAVVLRQQGSPGVIAAHVARERHYLGLWVYDTQGRRFLEMDLRRLAEDRLFLIHQRGWAYRDDDMPEFAAGAGRVTIQLLPDGRGTRTVKPRGDKGACCRRPRMCPRNGDGSRYRLSGSGRTCSPCSAFRAPTAVNCAKPRSCPRASRPGPTGGHRKECGPDI